MSDVLSSREAYVFLARAARGVGRGPLACFIFAPALRVFSRPEGYDAFTLEISHSKGLAVAVAACGACVCHA